MRLRMYDAEGNLWADSFELARTGVPARHGPGDRALAQDFARGLDRAVDKIVGAEPIPDYVEPDEHRRVDAWPELRRAREQGLTQIQLRRRARRHAR